MSTKKTNNLTFIDFTPGSHGHFLAFVKWDKLPSSPTINYHDLHKNNMIEKTNFQSAIVRNPELLENKLQTLDPIKSNVILHSYGRTDLIRKYFPDACIIKVVVVDSHSLLFTSFFERVPGTELTQDSPIKHIKDMYKFYLLYHSKDINCTTYADTVIIFDNLYKSRQSFNNEIAKLNPINSCDDAYEYFLPSKEFVLSRRADKQSLLQKCLNDVEQELAQDV